MLAARTISSTYTRAIPRGLPLCNIGGFSLAFKGALTFLFFRSSPQAGAGVTVAWTLGWLLTVGGYTILDSPDFSSGARRPAIPRWILAYLGLAGLSLAWTTTNSVPVAAAYWAATAADVLAVWLLLRYEPRDDNTVRIMHGFIAGAAVVAVIAWSAPVMADMRLGDEDFLHPNLIGFEFAIAALFSAYLAQRNKLWTWVCGAFVVTTIRTLSKGTIVGFLFAALYYILRGLKIRRRTRIYIGLAGTAVLVAFWGLMEAYLDVYTQGNNLETLTGRTYIWTTALDIATERPWLGHGFDSFRWIFPPFEAFQPWHAHNEWIQQFFAYGIVGILLVIAIYWSFYRLIRITQDRGLKSLSTAILILVLVRGLVDTDRFELCFPLWLMTMLSIALAAHAPPSLST
jgi:exopolysaccharide production protein ExoQ